MTTVLTMSLIHLQRPKQWRRQDSHGSGDMQLVIWQCNTSPQTADPKASKRVLTFGRCNVRHAFSPQSPQGRVSGASLVHESSTLIGSIEDVPRSIEAFRGSFSLALQHIVAEVIITEPDISPHLEAWLTELWEEEISQACPYLHSSRSLRTGRQNFPNLAYRIYFMPPRGLDSPEVT